MSSYHYFLIVSTVICNVWAVTNVLSQNEYVLSLTMVYDNKEFVANFAMDTFLEFYRCLCKTTTESCIATSGSQRVNYVQEKYFDQIYLQENRIYNRYVCEHVENGNIINCTKLQESQTSCSNTKNCWTYRNRDDAVTTCASGNVGIVWIKNQRMEGNYIFDVLEIKPCLPECLILNSIPSAPVQSTISFSTSMIRTIVSFVETSTEKSTDNLTISEINKTRNIVENDKYIDKMDTIVGIVVSFIVIVVLMTIFNIFLCRRRRSAFFAKLTNESTIDTLSTPTLTQIQMLVQTYPNFTTSSAATTDNFEISEKDNFSYAEFTELTEYDSDFSSHYNDSNLSLESSLNGGDEIEASTTGIYENYSIAIVGDLQDQDLTTDATDILPSDAYCASRDALSSDDCDAKKTLEYEDGLIYEELDCFSLENVHSLLTDNNDTNSNNDGSVSQNKIDDITIDKTLNICQPGSSTSSMDNSIPSNKNSGPDNEINYSKFNDKVTPIKDAHNIRSKPLNEKQQDTSSNANLSSTNMRQSGKHLSEYSTANVRSKLCEEVIDMSQGRKSITTVSCDISCERDKWLKDTRNCEETSNKLSSQAMKSGNKHPVGYRHEYFELEGKLQCNRRQIEDQEKCETV